MYFLKIINIKNKLKNMDKYQFYKYFQKTIISLRISEFRSSDYWKWTLSKGDHKCNLQSNNQIFVFWYFQGKKDFFQNYGSADQKLWVEIHPPPSHEKTILHVKNINHKFFCHSIFFALFFKEKKLFRDLHFPSKKVLKGDYSFVG